MIQLLPIGNSKITPCEYRDVASHLSVGKKVHKFNTYPMKSGLSRFTQYLNKKR